MLRTLHRAAIFSCLLSCGSFGAVYPPRPAATPGAPVADPTPARVVAHVSVTSEALRGALDEAIPKSGEGEVALLGGARHYSWQREALTVSFSQGRLVLDAHVDAKV